MVRALRQSLAREFDLLLEIRFSGCMPSPQPVVRSRPVPSALAVNIAAVLTVDDSQRFTAIRDSPARPVTLCEIDYVDSTFPGST